MMKTNGTGPRWVLVVKPEQRELLETLRQYLEGSGIEVSVERRSRERRRGSLGPAMERRTFERRRQRPVAVVSVANAPEEAEAPAAARSTGVPPGNGPVTHRCPTCLESLELELPRFPHPPARVEMDIRHAKVNGRNGHYVEIAAFTVSGRLILSQRVPARRLA
jgi:hypothetical protein